MRLQTIAFSATAEQFELDYVSLDAHIQPLRYGTEV